MTDPRHRPVVAWLVTGAALIAAMVVIGGITRLTGSGLSITEWDVLMGAIPPLNEAAWAELFAKYQATPQGQLVNQHFTLGEFKTIFWWEYIHRLLGRLLGVIFLVPYLWFVVTKRVDRRLAVRLLGILALGAFQGVLGWFMVASGLVRDPSVSHFRLAAHLLTAFATFGLTVWITLDLLQGGRPLPGRISSGVRRATVVLAVLVLLQITWGAFVAGLRAGYLFNTFPTMGGTWIPPGLGALGSWWADLVSNQVTVQFVHRMLAWLLAGGIVLWWLPARREPGLGDAPRWLLGAILLQFALGVVTILGMPHHPVIVGTLHQAGGLAVFGVLIWTGWRLKRAEP